MTRRMCGIEYIVTARSPRLRPGARFPACHLLKTAILLLSKKFGLSKQKTIGTEAQLRQAAKEALEADALLRWRWKAFELKRERETDAFVTLLPQVGGLKWHGEHLGWFSGGF